MTTPSDGTPPGPEVPYDLDPVETGYADTAPILLGAELGAQQGVVPPEIEPPVEPLLAGAELPPPPPLLSHLQPEYLTPAEAAAAYDDNVVLGSEHDVLPSEPVSRLPRSKPSGAGRVILPIALCLVGVVALGAGWTHLEADRAAEAQESIAAPSAKPPVPELGSPTATPSTSASASSSPTASTAASPSAKPSGASAAPSGSASPSARPTATTVPAADRSVPVVVLNATKRTGLAAAVAQKLRAKGWTVVSVANWRGKPVRLTTVFVTGNQQAAATMRRDVRSADGTLPTWAGMPKNRVVLVVADDYPPVR